MITATQVFAKFRGLIVVPLMLRAYGAAAFGVWVQVFLLAGVVTAVAESNFHGALQRFLPAASERERSSIFWDGLHCVGVASGILAGAMVLLAPVVAPPLGATTELVHLAAALVVVRTLSQYTSNVYRADGRTRLFALLDCTAMFAELVAVVIAVALDLSLTGAFQLVLAFEAGALVVSGIPVVVRIPFRRFAWSSARRVVVYSLPALPINVASFALINADRFIINAMLGQAAVGIYSAAYTIGSIPLFFARPIIVSLLPVASKLWDDGDRHGAGALLRRRGRVYLFFAVPTAVALAFVGPPLLTLIAGESHPEWSPLLLLSIGVGSVLYGMQQIGLHALFLEEKMISASVLYVVGAAINIGANFALLPYFGLAGAGLATALAYAAVSVPVQARAKLSMGGAFELTAIVKSVLASGVMAGALQMLPMTSPATIGVSCLAAGAVYLLVALALRYYTLDDLGFARRTGDA